MVQRISVEFDRARTNVVDGFQAVKSGNSDDADHFASEARAAMDGVPEDFSYIQSYRSAIDRKDFNEAFEALANFAAYVRQYDSDEYEFDYQSLALERVEDEYRMFSGR